jgi:hypothetical protein
MTHIGNIDRGQPPRFDPSTDGGEAFVDELRDLVHTTDDLTTEDLETIQREVVGGLSKHQSQVSMTDEASAAWDTIAAEVAATPSVNTWESPLETPDVPTDLTKVTENG